MNTTIEASPIIECNLDRIKVENHYNLKDNIMHIIQDLYQGNVNYNTSHHQSVWTSPSGLQSIHSFSPFVEGPEISYYASVMRDRYQIKSNKKIAITDMWVTITPPGGLLLPKPKIKSLVTGTYFVHTPQENASMNFRKPIDPHWFDKVYDPFNRTCYNSPESLIDMQEGYVYFYPSYIESYTTTNVSDQERITIDFVLDAVDK